MECETRNQEDARVIAAARARCANRARWHVLARTMDGALYLRRFDVRAIADYFATGDTSACAGGRVYDSHEMSLSPSLYEQAQAENEFAATLAEIRAEVNAQVEAAWAGYDADAEPVMARTAEAKDEEIAFGDMA
jgi:hypothetical protein